MVWKSPSITAVPLNAGAANKGRHAYNQVSLGNIAVTRRHERRKGFRWQEAFVRRTWLANGCHHLCFYESTTDDPLQEI
jgi:hypothetical protein